MLDINFVKENSKEVKENIKKKFQDSKLKLVDEVLKLDEQWRKLKYNGDSLRAERNKISKQINEAKKNKNEKEAKKLIIEAKKIPEKISKNEKKEKKLEEDMRKKLSSLPNILSKNTPFGKSDKYNIVEKIYGKPKKMGFEPKSHTEIAEQLGLIDFDSSARVSGNGFYYLQGEIALLNRALINYTLDVMMKEGFEYIETPLMLREEIIDRVTDLKDKQQQIYLVENSPKMALIGTSEHSLIGRYVNQEINEKKLPLLQTSYSMCFRKEIGSHGIDERGLFRTHQFNKVEMVVICKPQESEKLYEKLKSISIKILKELDMPFRILKICSGDLGDLKSEQVDFEVYSPRKKNYIECGSCSNLTDAQARKLGISTRIKGERIIPHSLNNTAIATSRILVSILENNQNKDGSVNIPKVLQKYMHGKKKIEKSKIKSR